MNEQPKISVVIPVYNVEKYLPECLNSLIDQSDFPNWEAICVNDGSSDKSGEILNEYAARDSRFRIVHQKNEGVSSARNKGISLATAPYLMFIDSDDWIEPNMLRVLYNTIERDCSDMVACGYYYDTIKKSSIKYEPMHKRHRWNKSELGVQPVTKNLICSITPSLSNKIFKREIFLKNSLYHDTDIAFGEDYIVVLKYLIFSKIITAINTPLYHYRQQNESVSYQYVKMNLPIEYYEMTIMVPFCATSAISQKLSKKTRQQYTLGLFILLLNQISVVNSTFQFHIHPEYARYQKKKRQVLWSLFRMTPKIPAVFHLTLHLLIENYRQLKRRIRKK